MPSYITSTTGDTWAYWTNSIIDYPCTASTTMSSNTVWIRWCHSATTTNNTAITMTAADNVWGTWQTGTHTGTGIYAPHVRTEAEIAEDEARVLRWRQQEILLEAQRKVAQERAEKLLLENLTLHQRAQFYKERSFVVEGKNGFRYRIREGRSGNVDMIRADGMIQHRLCAHPVEAVPDCDTMLAQKILIELDEDAFLKTANRHHVLTPSHRVLEPLH